MEPERPDARNGFGLPRQVRITASDEIRSLFRRGKRSKTRHLDAFVSPSPAGVARLGVVVPKHKRTIVQRNLLKRRLRELGRTLLLPALGNCGAPFDVLFRARPEAYTAPFAALRDEVAALTKELCSRAR
ncbi:ribonuclease P protein component [Longimicrobium sp.]|uniref:ribonuclease P protein component n=1 Tax=Longimicrobium sp. TaxID=2029185 RepID=UPI003B3B2FE4